MSDTKTILDAAKQLWANEGVVLNYTQDKDGFSVTLSDNSKDITVFLEPDLGSNAATRLVKWRRELAAMRLEVISLFNYGDTRLLDQTK